MDNVSYRNNVLQDVGLPYDDINWYDIEGQPFGPASRFNAIVFNDANNIVDIKGAMAVGGDFVSPRGFSVAFGNNSRLARSGYSPDRVRFLVGGNVSMGGPLVVIGHVVAGGNFRAGSGSTYIIGKDGSADQSEELEYLYQAQNGSRYWAPSDKGDHYLIPSYDVPRYIPSSRIDANVSGFFQQARDSIMAFKNCIDGLEANGSVIDNIHEWILRGNDPEQNVFEIDVSPNGIINKGIRAEVPEGSLVIVKLRTGNNAHLQYGLMGEQWRANHTLYVFEDAQHIYMEVPADIWGSILAPQAMFHAHSTGGHVSGNAAFDSFAVNANSGFEFHQFPFVGGVECGEVTPSVPEEAPQPPQEVQPITAPAPVCPPCPEARPCPVPPPCPEAPPCPTPPPCPVCPEAEVCMPCPEAPPCPVCPTCPEPVVCPVCPTCPEPEVCPTCPECPPCPEQEAFVGFIPVPVPMPCDTCPVQMPCPDCPECLIKEGIISGCIEGCNCCRSHEWEVKLYQISGNRKILAFCEWLSCGERFRFKVPYEGCYKLEICPSRYVRKSSRCKAIVTFTNIGVSNFIMD